MTISNHDVNHAATLKHPKQMQCIEISKYGDPSVLLETTRTIPTLQSHEILIKVAAAGVNRPDVLQRRGLYPPPSDASDLPGLEVAGSVVAIGKEVTEYSMGDQVCALSPGGGYAEYCAVPVTQCLPVPKGLSLIEAASLPETYFTVWFNLFLKGALVKNQTLLIHGGSSGIGTTAIQLAKAFGVTTFITAGTDEKCTFCSSLGADVVINYRKQDYQQVIVESTDSRGVDMILDIVGGDYIQKNIASLSQGGCLTNLAFLNGSKAELDMMPVLLKGLTITGSVLRPQPVATKTRIKDGLQNHVWPLFETKIIKPVIYQTFPLHEAHKAHELMESSQHIGKIVLVNEEYVAEM